MNSKRSLRQLFTKAIKSTFPGPQFLQALARIRRCVVQVQVIEKDDLHLDALFTQDIHHLHAELRAAVGHEGHLRHRDANRFFQLPWICTTRRRIQASAGINRGPTEVDLIAFAEAQMST